VAPDIALGSAKGEVDASIASCIAICCVADIQNRGGIAGSSAWDIWSGCIVCLLEERARAFS
jgi:hypothetical protein